MRAQKKLPDQLNLSEFEDKSLLILDDDDPLRGRLARAMEKKGFQVKEAKTVLEGINIVKNAPPAFACVDLRLEDGNGLDVIKELTKNKKDSRIVMLTGYGNLPTAVAAVKAGAIDYIAKPVDADDVESALLASPESKANPLKIRCQLTELSGSTFTEYLNFVIGTFLKLHEDLKCTEELYKEYSLKDLQGNLN